MPSFDIVSEIKKDELQNAIDNANRELQTRYDFRGVEASFVYNKADFTVKVEADEEFQVQQMNDILLSKLVKRNIEVTACEFGDITRTGKKSIEAVKFKQGIDKELGKKIVKKIKDSKIKVDAKMNDDSLRVQGKKRDDLQAVIALVRAEDFGQPLQFNNFRD